LEITLDPKKKKKKGTALSYVRSVIKKRKSVVLGGKKNRQAHRNDK